MNIAVLGINHKGGSAEVREKVAVKEPQIPLFLERLSEQFEESVLLSTCNRTEVYVAFSEKGYEETKVRLLKFLLNGQHNNQELVSKFYFYSEAETARHLFKVASSLDSIVVGETQILGQVKDAYQNALTQKATGSRLNRLFQHSFRVAKRVRTETDIARGNHSVSSVACRLAEEKLGSLKDKQVMIIGAGKIGEVTLQHLIKKGAEAIFVGNRTFEKAEELTKRFGGTALHFKDCFEKMAECDLVISQTSSPHYIICKKNISANRKTQVFIDLAIPRDIEPGVVEAKDIFLYNLDSLQEIVDRSFNVREEEAKKAEAIIEEELSNWR
ncbi:MAG: glutamyl-tRNA reductase [Candidatus Desantisbacteria bacterium]